MDENSRMRAIRGATSVPSDARDQVVEATSKLLKEMMDRNEVTNEDLVSIIFTATPDITSEFPAAAAREIGISDIPLLCATEMNVANAVPLCIRVLMHAYTARDALSLRHIYLENARQLRTDLVE